MQICKVVSSKYTRSKVRKKMPTEFAYVIDELLHVDYNDDNKRIYCSEIIHSIIDNSVADKFIVALCELIQNLTIDNLHIIGDIFDRAPGRTSLWTSSCISTTWTSSGGNRDISWMGALRATWPYCGNVAHRHQLQQLRRAGGRLQINLRPCPCSRPRCTDDPCERFVPLILDGKCLRRRGSGPGGENAKGHRRDPVQGGGRHYQAATPSTAWRTGFFWRLWTLRMGTVTVEGKEYPMLTGISHKWTRQTRWKLTDGEKELLKTLKASFKHSGRLLKHVKSPYPTGYLQVLQFQPAVPRLYPHEGGRQF